MAVRCDDYCELGYWLGFEYWGLGYATEVCKGLLEFAQISTSFNCVNANVYKENFRSFQVLKNLGLCKLEKGKSLVCLDNRIWDAYIMNMYFQVEIFGSLV